MLGQDGLFIGLMSGTSLDAVDAALLEITPHEVRLQASHTHTLPDILRKDILALCEPGANEINRAGSLHLALGQLFADAVLALLDQEGLQPNDIVAIGSHGQTVRHRPDLGFSVQLGSADMLAAQTGITTVCDFRNHDMVLGGQGAPLVPVFHRAIFSQADTRRAIVNVGGMANVSLLDDVALVGGFDTGPGNVLLDHWVHLHTHQPYDQDGTFAASGTMQSQLLERLLDDDFFKQSGPKSTGRERFNAHWLAAHLTGDEKPEDVQATLTELTATSIANSLRDFAPEETLVCGGGAHNRFLLQRLAHHLPGSIVDTTAVLSWHPDWIEAACFAWLAWARLNRMPATSPLVTGATRDAISGAVYLP